MRLHSWTAAILLLMLASPAAADPSLVTSPYKAEYAVYANGFQIGEMTRELKPAGEKTWVLETDLYTTGLAALFKRDRVTERSIWRLGEYGLMPLVYRARYTGREKAVEERLSFDWSDRSVRSLRDGKETELKVPPGALDKLMYQVALRRDLSEGKRHLQYVVADRGKIRDLEFEVVGEEEVQTSLGTFRTLKVEKEQTTLWVAPALDYMLVKLHQEEDDYSLTSYITGLEQ